MGDVLRDLVASQTEALQRRKEQMAELQLLKAVDAVVGDMTGEASDDETWTSSSVSSISAASSRTGPTPSHKRAQILRRAAQAAAGIDVVGSSRARSTPSRTTATRTVGKRAADAAVEHIEEEPSASQEIEAIYQRCLTEIRGSPIKSSPKGPAEGTSASRARRLYTDRPRTVGTARAGEVPWAASNVDAALAAAEQEWELPARTDSGGFAVRRTRPFSPAMRRRSLSLSPTRQRRNASPTRVWRSEAARDRLLKSSRRSDDDKPGMLTTNNAQPVSSLRSWRLVGCCPEATKADWRSPAPGSPPWR